MTDDIQNKIPDEKNLQNEPKLPKRYQLYEHLNVNEKYLDFFIIGTIVILLGIIIFAVL